MTSTTSPLRRLRRRLVSIGTALALVAVTSGIGLIDAPSASAAPDWPMQLTVSGAANTFGATVRNGLLYSAGRDGLIRTTDSGGSTATVVTFTDAPKLNAVAVDSAGNIFFTADNDPKIYRIAATALPLTTTLGSATVYTSAASGEIIYGLAIDRDDRLYYGTTISPSVYRYVPGAAATAVVPNVPAAVFGMGFAPDGSLYFADNDDLVFSATDAQLRAGTPIGMSDLEGHPEMQAGYLAIAFTGFGLQFYYTVGAGATYYLRQFGSGYTAGSVSITGTPRVGQTLTATTSNWTSGSTFTYQWNRDGSPISGATGSTYVPIVADIGHSLTVKVTGENNNETASTTSGAVGPVQSSYVAGTVTVTGTAAAGRTLTGSTQNWPAGSTLSYQWNRNGAAISGATASSYFVVSGDVNTELTLTVTGALNGESGSTTSAAVGPVDSYQPGTVVITGTPVVGQPLTAVTSNWPDGSTFTYGWFASDGRVLAMGSERTFTPRSFDAGLRIQVQVTGNTNGEQGMASSDLTAAVTDPPPLAAPLFDGQVSTTASFSQKVGEAFSYTDLGATGNPTPTYSVTDEDGDGSILPPGVSFDNGVLSGTTTKAGEWKIQITATNSQGTATEYIKLTVAAGPAAGIQAVVSPGSADGSTSPTDWYLWSSGAVTQGSGGDVAQNVTVTSRKGSSITVRTAPVDQYGNQVQSTDALQVSSSMETDTVDVQSNSLAVVTFNHASPHVITVQQGSLRNSFLVEVSDPDAVTPAAPAASGSLAVTGTDLGASLWVGIGLLLTGLAVFVAMRLRSRRAQR